MNVIPIKFQQSYIFVEIINNKLVLKFIWKCKGNNQDLNKNEDHQISKHKADHNKLKGEVVQMVKTSFIVGQSYTRDDIKSMLIEIYRQYNIKTKAKASDIKLYFNAKECKKYGESAYKLLEPLF